MPNIASPTSPRLCVMFYLPVVTPWWLENIVINLIRVMAREHDVHVLVPPLWRNTGLSQSQLGLLGDLDHVNWHLLDGEDHPKLRTNASDEEDLFQLVDAIAPDLVLCRSADTVTPEGFPGTVRYIMEGAAPPLNTAPAWITLSPALFDYGIMPKLSPFEEARLDVLAGPLLAALSSQAKGQGWRASHGFGPNQTLIGLPLEYEHEENFFGQHHQFSDNAAMIAQMADALPDGAVLAVTNHPLNDLYGDNSAIKTAIAEQSDKAVLLKSGEVAGAATAALAQHADAMIVGNSKSWAVAAAHGTPILRLSDFATGDWANAYKSSEDFFADLATHCAHRADTKLARRWFAYHLYDAVFDPAAPTLTASDIVARAHVPVDPARWTQGLARHYALPQDIAA